jgi:hypothetical protein
MTCYKLMLDNGVNVMKKMKVKYGNVLDYFTRDLNTLPTNYVKECEKFFTEIKDKQEKRKKVIDSEVKIC